jgi:vacuolar-type H+-ATPase subunit E/Vma4
MDPSSQAYAQHMKQMQAMQAQAPPAPQVQAAKIRAQTTLLQQQAENERAQGELQQKMLEGRLQLVHEAIQQKDQQIHEAHQSRREGSLQLDTNHLQIVLKLIPAIAQIIAAEKASAQELGPDVEDAAGAIQ